MCMCIYLSVLPSEELPGESGLLERLAIRCRAKTALPVFWKFKGQIALDDKLHSCPKLRACIVQ